MYSASCCRTITIADIKYAPPVGRSHRPPPNPNVRSPGHRSHQEAAPLPPQSSNNSPPAIKEPSSSKIMSSTSRSSSSTSSSSAASSSPFPERFRIDDPRIAWVNGRPYLAHDFLGQGGFGQVYRVELLIPVGMKCALDEDGDVQFSEDGLVFLVAADDEDDYGSCDSESVDGGAVGDRGQLSSSGGGELETASSGTGTSGGVSGAVSAVSGPTENIGLADGGFGSSSRTKQEPHVSASVEGSGRKVHDARHLNLSKKAGQGLSFAVSSSSSGGAPALWRSGAASAEFLSSEKIPLVIRGASSAASKTPLSVIKAPLAPVPEDGPVSDLREPVPEDPRPAPERDDVLETDDDIPLHGSGVFFALKLQTAKNLRMYTAFVKEVEHMRRFVGVHRVLQMKDSECEQENLRVVILLELAKCDLQSFLLKQKHLLDAGAVCRIFRCMVEAVAVVHSRGVVHFDLKPQNFLLVPLKNTRTSVCASSAASRSSSSRAGSSRASSSSEKALSDDAVLEGEITAVSSSEQEGVSVRGREDLRGSEDPNTALICTGTGPINSALASTNSEQSFSNSLLSATPATSSSGPSSSSSSSSSSGQHQHDSSPVSERRTSSGAKWSTSSSQHQRYCLKLGDFGLAHRLREDTSHVSGYGAGGTMLYMAPEALFQPTEDGKKKWGAAVDVWALGVMLYQFLHCGVTPWDQHRALGEVALGVAIADPRHVVKWERDAAWTQQKKLLSAWREGVVAGAAAEAKRRLATRKLAVGGSRGVSSGSGTGLLGVQACCVRGGDFAAS